MQLKSLDQWLGYIDSVRPTEVDLNLDRIRFIYKKKLIHERLYNFNTSICNLKNSINLQTHFLKRMTRSSSPVRTPGFHPGNRGSNPLRDVFVGSVANAAVLEFILCFHGDHLDRGNLAFCTSPLIAFRVLVLRVSKPRCIFQSWT